MDDDAARCGARAASRTATSADALVADLEDAAAVLGSPTRHARTDAAGMLECEAIVLCPRAPFTNSATCDVRMAGLTANAPLIGRFGRHLAGYRGTVVVVTNPVDVLTRLFAEASGCARVYGVGAETDTARYRITLARAHGVPVEAVTGGQVIGEHGEAAVARWAAVGGRVLAHDPDLVRAALADRPRVIARGLGRVRCGPAAAVVSALRAAFGLTDATVVLSTRRPDGTYSGRPVRFTGGIPHPVDLDLTPAERAQLAAAERKITAAHAIVHRS
ncbi:lactate dehydrogenase [Streptomyces sp. NPDC006798]|uniref:lactate dehydrogenase n=1 Tax=Streptomyces sp. NPDC006798 TaxID=3155462 RepID=UPI0033CEAE22